MNKIYYILLSLSLILFQSVAAERRKHVTDHLQRIYYGNTSVLPQTYLGANGARNAIRRKKLSYREQAQLKDVTQKVIDQYLTHKKEYLDGSFAALDLPATQNERNKAFGSLDTLAQTGKIPFSHPDGFLIKVYYARHVNGDFKEQYSLTFRPEKWSAIQSFVVHKHYKPLLTKGFRIDTKTKNEPNKNLRSKKCIEQLVSNNRLFVPIGALHNISNTIFGSQARVRMDIELIDGTKKHIVWCRHEPLNIRDVKKIVAVWR